MSRDTVLLTDSYKDSIKLLEATRAMLAVDGVDWAWAVMATPVNLETLVGEGFGELTMATANDLVLAASGTDNGVDEALAIAQSTLFGAVAKGEFEDEPTSSLRGALSKAPDANLAMISVPGPYAALEANKALSAGLHVLLFSDNVPVADEVSLKDRARSLGLLVMGPGAGTAMLGTVGLAFSNRVKPGPVGVIAAAGTGAQEVMSLLDRWGVGVSHVIGLGGRDLSESVNGRMAAAAIEALEDDDETESILLVSKPPAKAVAEGLLGATRRKRIVASLIGLQEPLRVGDDVVVCNTLEQGVIETLTAMHISRPDVVGNLDTRLAEIVSSLPPRRARLVGLFSGGTLCYEAMTIASTHVGAIHSNTPLDKLWTLPAPVGAHVCLDLGEEQYTVGRPHPMIDPAARVEFLREQIDDDSVAVVLLDVVIGDGAHEDPAGRVAPVAAEIVASGAAVIAYVLGTSQDPQGFDSQRAILREAGCLVPETSARAALGAAAIVNRDPALIHDDLAIDLVASRR